MPSKTPMSGFRLQFDPVEIPALVERYRPSLDDTATKAGAEIRAGARTLTNLEAIFKWKTKGRGISRLRKNCVGEIADALNLATTRRLSAQPFLFCAACEALMCPSRPQS